MVDPREYWMINSGLCFLAVVWFGSTQTPSPPPPPLPSVSSTGDTQEEGPGPTFHFDADPDPSFQIKAKNLGKVLKIGSYSIHCGLSSTNWMRIRIRIKLITQIRIWIRIQLIILMRIRILPFIWCGSRFTTLLSIIWMKIKSGCQCQSRNSPGFDSSILRHNGFWGAPQMKQC